MHGHMSRCTVTCHDARSHERKMAVEVYRTVFIWTQDRGEKSVLISLKFMCRSNICRHTLGDRKATTHTLSQQSELPWQYTGKMNCKALGLTSRKALIQSWLQTKRKTSNAQRKMFCCIFCVTHEVFYLVQVCCIWFIFATDLENTYPCRRSTQVRNATFNSGA
jgi:hypothetical protein